MRITSAPFFALTTSLLLLTAGCYYPTENRPGYGTETQPAYAPEAGVPTSLVIVVEGECTQEEYRARRLEIISYLIERGYITQESDLIGDPANATRIIRAIVSNGGFSLSVFNQSAAVESVPDLEDTDILYPADPYFIFGFEYLYEIGPRRLPPRSRDYRPHPRPPHSNPPPGHRDYDHDRHWARPGQPNHGDNHGAPPANRRPRDENHPRPDQGGGRPPRPAPDQAPGNSVPPNSGNHDNRPPAGNPPRNHDHPRPDPTTQPPVAPPGQKPDNHGPSHPGNRPKLPPDAITPKNPGQPRPDRDDNVRPAPNAPRGGDRPTSPGTSRPPAPPHSPPPPPPPKVSPVPEKSTPAPEPKDRPTEDRDRHEVQR